MYTVLISSLNRFRIVSFSRSLFFRVYTVRENQGKTYLFRDGQGKSGRVRESQGIQRKSQGKVGKSQGDFFEKFLSPMNQDPLFFKIQSIFFKINYDRTSSVARGGAGGAIAPPPLTCRPKSRMGKTLHF